MNILIVGSGGREHAFAWKVAQSQQVDRVWVAPGNAGTALENKVENINIDVLDIDALISFAKDNRVALTIIGPEAPLAAGIVDRFQKENLACFGPTKAAAQLETSKAFCKNFMHKENIPTAAFATFTEKQKALDYLEQQHFPIVIKASGLAAGKGVIIAENLEQAKAAVIGMLDEKSFGAAGKEIVIEEFITGEELSFIVMVDGKNILPLASSQDHKRRDNGDLGPNTGGMGAYSPAPISTAELNKKIMQQVIEPTVNALARDGHPFVGFLYAGLMITEDGRISVLEYNCRMGDPETQPILFRLESDLVELCLAALDGKLDQVKTQWDSRTAIAVVMAAGGYPEKYHKGDVIKGLNTTLTDCKVFHAGTTNKDGDIVTSGGRVLAVTALGDDIQSARNHAYKAVNQIRWKDCYYRTDIAYRALRRPVLD